MPLDFGAEFAGSKIFDSIQKPNSGSDKLTDKEAVTESVELSSSSVKLQLSCAASSLSSASQVSGCSKSSMTKLNSPGRQSGC